MPISNGIRRLSQASPAVIFTWPRFIDTPSRCVISTHTSRSLASQSWDCRFLPIPVTTMSKLKLTLACWDYDRTRPLIDGRVQAEGIDLEIKVMRPRETFPRMLEHKEVEVWELSLASYVTLKARGTCTFIAVPVALSKIFRHSCIYIRTDAGIRTPQDLRGKRVGTTQLGSTGVVFMNGMLQHEYGVSLEDIHWFIGGLTDPTPRPVLRFNLPAKIKIDFLPLGQTLEGMLESGDLDALFALYIPSIFQKGSPRIARLFPNYYEVEQDYYRRTRIFPIMHTVVV